MIPVLNSFVKNQKIHKIHRTEKIGKNSSREPQLFHGSKLLTELGRKKGLSRLALSGPIERKSSGNILAEGGNWPLPLAGEAGLAEGNPEG